MTSTRDEAAPGRQARIARTKRRAVILVCGKCLKRAKGGKAGGKAIRKALAGALAARLAEGASAGPRKARLARTSCLGLCPKRAVVAASAATLGRDEVVILDGVEAAPAAAEILLADRVSPP